MADAISGVHTSGNTSKAWVRDYNEIFWNLYGGQPSQAAQIVNFGTPPGGSNLTHYVKRGLMVPLGNGQAMYEGQGIPLDTLLDGPNKTVYPSKYGVGIQVTYEAMKDDRNGIYKDLFGKIALGMMYTQEQAATNLLNNGFVTTYNSGLDSLALFSASHVTYGGTGATYSNLQTGSLSRTTLQQALDKIKTLKDDRGRPIMVTPKLLVIPPELEWKAKELLLSEYQPETANNEINALKGTLSYVVNRYLTSTTAWFVLADKSVIDLQHYWFDQPKPKAYEDDNTDSMIFKSTMRMVDSFWNWRGVVGSAGT